MVKDILCRGWQNLEKPREYLDFAGCIDPIVVAQVCPCDVKTAIDKRQISNGEINDSQRQCKQMSMAVYQ